MLKQVYPLHRLLNFNFNVTHGIYTIWQERLNEVGKIVGKMDTSYIYIYIYIYSWTRYKLDWKPIFVLFFIF